MSRKATKLDPSSYRAPSPKPCRFIKIPVRPGTVRSACVDVSEPTKLEGVIRRKKRHESSSPAPGTPPRRPHRVVTSSEGVVPVGNLRPEILVVQSAQNWHRQRATDGLDSTRDRRVLLQRKVRPSGLMHRSKEHHHSITSSAIASNVGGTVMASVLAGLRLST